MEFKHPPVPLDMTANVAVSWGFLAFTAVRSSQPWLGHCAWGCVHEIGFR